ncbi:hypothetical protein RRG08_003353 [Elysia crispata]|uniref:Ig-like domain-containing protein n=1 Tax=Elysia crispata TaxID=231223 RepID=A0AAE1CWD1_9GAST|nr:hypothetical protein RRG08_003353 [Elysia crispata]
MSSSPPPPPHKSGGTSGSEPIQRKTATRSNTIRFAERYYTSQPEVWFITTGEVKAPLTTQDVRGHMHRSATLRCMLAKHNKDWYVINWHRINLIGDPVLLVRLPVRTKIPEWGPQLSPDIQSRIRPIITVEKHHVEFNIKLTNLTCEDDGHYSCSAVTNQGEIISTAKLTVKAKPQSPIVTSILTPHGKGSSLILECKADVGLPPRLLYWYVRPPGDFFTRVDDDHDIPQEVHGCRYSRTRTVDVTALRSPPGTNFRCAYPGNIDKPGMFNDYIVEDNIDIAGNPAMQEVREEPKLGAVCTGMECSDLEIPSDDSPGGPTDTSPIIPCPSTRPAILIFIVCFFHWLCCGSFILWSRL